MPKNPQDLYTYRAVNNIIRITGCDKSNFDDILDEVNQAQYFASSKAVVDTLTELVKVDPVSLSQKLVVAADDQERRIAELAPDPVREPEQSGGDGGAL
jgi:hypothetical protein